MTGGFSAAGSTFAGRQDALEAGERNSTLANFEYWFANGRGLPKPVDFSEHIAAELIFLPGCHGCCRILLSNFRRFRRTRDAPRGAALFRKPHFAATIVQTEAATWSKSGTGPFSFTIEVVLTLLQIRYHPNFKGEDTLLFAGSRDDIDLLRSFFFGWNGDELDLIAYLQTRGKVYLFSVSTLCACGGTQSEIPLHGAGTGGPGSSRKRINSKSSISWTGCWRRRRRVTNLWNLAVLAFKLWFPRMRTTHCPQPKTAARTDVLSPSGTP